MHSASKDPASKDPTTATATALATTCHALGPTAISGPTSAPSISLPLVVAHCGAVLKQPPNLRTPGLFRVSGSSRRLRTWKLALAADDWSVVGNDLSCADSHHSHTIHDVASLLKAYLIGLDDCLVASDNFLAFVTPLQDNIQLQQTLLENIQVQLTSTTDDKTQYLISGIEVTRLIEHYQQLITTALPQHSMHLFIYLLDLLSMVASYSRVNMMDSFNLSIIFQPSFLSSPYHSSKDDMQLARLVIQFLIQTADVLIPRIIKTLSQQ
ncbi:hypothetical protein TBLA_0A07960 [Henningerozyma blattae CBS 6284]|uniref:Rho-GAP domain-containing protein n=1 Tax=Henningerozyma blattae (strain ATCC 34711 / CBS 6284 / DSM 70876 / NBRC 10599 / NRRL Y-10934 / UCD 77-7) TaxID=1071380 RepID=I2GWT4_HENB6|nr:hypothetical protein TBLA_0A07960 [Tetrapisispora blattae CBS 6284]CCH58586.1 hypothetical protein TBLA_0A07960 [Tetrapisispora blattae CBS 6284]